MQEKLTQAIALVDGDEALMPFTNILELPPIPRWTKEKAYQMAQEAYRHTYLESA